VVVSLCEGGYLIGELGGRFCREKVRHGEKSRLE
jgi:hypothetical protein